MIIPWCYFTTPNIIIYTLYMVLLEPSWKVASQYIKLSVFICICDNENLGGNTEIRFGVVPRLFFWHIFSDCK